MLQSGPEVIVVLRSDFNLANSLLKCDLHYFTSCLFEYVCKLSPLTRFLLSGKSLQLFLKNKLSNLKDTSYNDL